MKRTVAKYLFVRLAWRHYERVQMPPGYPVATVALDKAGARNAAWLAASILALHDPAIAEKLRQARLKNEQTVLKAAKEIEAKY